MGVFRFDCFLRLEFWVVNLRFELSHGLVLLERLLLLDHWVFSYESDLCRISTWFGFGFYFGWLYISLG